MPGTDLKLVFVLVLAVVLARGASAQTPTAAAGTSPARFSPGLGAPEQDGDDSRPAPGYVLGADDEISIRVLDSQEASVQQVRIGADGYIHLPLAGRVRAKGLTVSGLQSALRERLRPYIRDPQVVVVIQAYRSRPVSVLGAVHRPGVHHLRGPKTLVEILSLAGGLRADAGHAIKITRRLDQQRVPLATAADDSTGQFSVAEVDLKKIMEAENPAENIPIKPYDIITVPRAEMIYVVGEVVRSGGFVLSERKSMSVLQALALAGGLGANPKPNQARILRPVAGREERTEVAIQLKYIIEGKSPDISLHRDDILFVPKSGGKIAAKAAARAAIQIGSGIAIFSTR